MDSCLFSSRRYGYFLPTIPSRALSLVTAYFSSSCDTSTSTFKRLHYDPLSTGNFLRYMYNTLVGAFIHVRFVFSSDPLYL